jgi:hypothetical protein
MSRWYRAYAGTVTDEKLIEAAVVADVSRSITIATWHCLLESAATKNNCGSYETSARRIAAILGESVSQIEALFSAFDEIGLTSDGAISSWKKRQFDSDSSTERSRKHRQNKRNGDATLQQHDETPPEAEEDTETDINSSDEERPSGDGPAFTAEDVFNHYRELARALGLPVPRDFTPERRHLVRGRMRQYSLDDFRTVFGKCRDSPFLRGDRKDGRTPLTFDWLMQKRNFQKTLEGNFDG